MAIKSLQAREIVREAKRLGIRMERGNYNFCLKGVLIKSGYLQDLVKHSYHKINEAEAGFEDCTVQYSGHAFGISKANKNGRYYKMGQRVAKLAGL